MSASRIDMTGRTFGFLTVLRAGSKNKNGSYKWVCKCDCGKTVEISGVNLRVANGTKSCGCLIATSNKFAKTTHGHSTAGKNGSGSPSYKSWIAMLNRCKNENVPGYHNYGGRGIKVCSRWKRFENFLSDMGERPASLTLDRINNDGNYEPGNCRWASQIQQHNNRRDNHRLSYGGKTLTIAEWSRLSGTRHRTINGRIDRGWPVEEAIFGRNTPTEG